MLDTRLRNRQIQRLATRLGDIYGDIEHLSLNIRRWQRQLDHLDDYVTARREWIAGAESQIDELVAQAEVLEAQYFSLNGEE